MSARVPKDTPALAARRAAQERTAAQLRRISYKLLADRLGITLEECTAKREAGLRWCGKCRRWQPEADFAALHGKTRKPLWPCRECRSVHYRAGLERGRQ